MGRVLFVHVNKWAAPHTSDAVPISLGYLAAALAGDGHRSRILGDYQNAPLSPRLFQEALLAPPPPLFLGFTVYQENIHQVRAWARFAKRLLPDLPVVLGGPQVTFMPGAALEQMDEVDVLCRGEGEEVVTGLARALEAGVALTTVPGIGCREQGRVVETPALPPAVDLDRYPSPYLTGQLDIRGKERLILLTSRGCNAPCTFCYTSRANRGRIRFHSVERVVEELVFLKKRGVRDFWFADPNFAHDRQRLEELLEAICRRVPGIGFWCQTRSHLVDRPLLQSLKRAGCHTLALGLESASPAVLERIKKGITPSDVARAVRLIQEAGIQPELFTMFGLPGESEGEALATLDFVRGLDVAIDGNSVSQQLHLFFGAALNRAPEAHGIRPLARTRPAYLSVCRDFETETMDQAAIARVARFWRFFRRDFQDKTENIFQRAGFITAHLDDLGRRPEPLLHLAEIYLELEEYGPLAALAQRLAREFGGEPAVRAFLAGGKRAYRGRRRLTATTGCRVVFDCDGMVDGRVHPATSCRYREAVLGDGTLLADFEQGLSGLANNRSRQFPVRFPADYGEPTLAGRTVTFVAFVHLVQEPVDFPDLAALLAAPPRNHYRFTDLATLRQHNERLYYLALRDTAFKGLAEDATDFLALLGYTVRLGKWEEAAAMAATLPPEPTLRRHGAEFLLAANRPQAALHLVADLAAKDRDCCVTAVKAAIEAGDLDTANRFAASPLLDNDIQGLDLRVGLAALRQRPLPEYLRRCRELLDLQVAEMATAAGPPARRPQPVARPAPHRSRFTEPRRGSAPPPP